MRLDQPYHPAFRRRRAYTHPKGRIAVAKKNAEAVEVTQQHIEDALRAEQGGDARMRGAFNPAEFARKAEALARVAAPFIAIAAATNWKNPVAAAQALVKLYAMIQGTQDNPETAPAA